LKKKKFKLSEAEIKPLAEGFGGCFATDAIVVDGLPVGFFYREEPDFDVDSGWRFLAGNESQDYIDNPDNLAIYDVNTIANYDPDVIPLLGEPIGSAFERDPETKQFIAVDLDSDDGDEDFDEDEFDVDEDEDD
jgi:hypothetical protein